MEKFLEYINERILELEKREFEARSNNRYDISDRVDARISELKLLKNEFFRLKTMKGSKEYFLKLQEETYNNLGNDEKMYLNHLGLEVRQLPTDEDLQDENYKKIRNQRITYWNEEQKYLFSKRNK